VVCAHLATCKRALPISTGWPDACLVEQVVDNVTSLVGYVEQQRNTTVTQAQAVQRTTIVRQPTMLAPTTVNQNSPIETNCDIQTNSYLLAFRSFQLAFYRMHGRAGSTYESAANAHYKHGRQNHLPKNRCSHAMPLTFTTVLLTRMWCL
jgi:hypothetical protein